MDTRNGTEAGRPTDASIQKARVFLDAYLAETGVTRDTLPRRYLWSDAFAVCTLLELGRLGLKPEADDADDYLELALRLVDQVHRVLGRHRRDDSRTGWLSGLDETDGAAHPTAGGLRIGKPLPERRPRDPVNQRLEWERDGQYYHYLTRWMHALLRVHEATADPACLRWARELARASYRGFVQDDGRGAPHLAWKMSIDLSRPLVEAPGHHDALDGWITCLTLEAAVDSLREKSPQQAESLEVALQPVEELTTEILGLREMSGLEQGTGWATEDPLGIGGLLMDAWRVGQLDLLGSARLVRLMELLLTSAEMGLRAFLRSGLLQTAPAFRLPFREFGLALGLHAVERLAVSPVMEAHGEAADQAMLGDLVGELQGAVPLISRIQETWLDEEHQALECWQDHRDINAVMLATCLVPGGYLGI